MTDRAPKAPATSRQPAGASGRPSSTSTSSRRISSRSSVPHVSPRTEELRRVAFHEAGHAVVALMLGLEVELVSIVPEPGVNRMTEGHCRLALSEAWKRLAVVCLASGEAERPVGGDGAIPEDDLEHAVWYLKHVRSPRVLNPPGLPRRFGRRAWLIRLRKEAAQLVATHRGPIERVAEALLEKRTLTSAELRQVAPELCVCKHPAGSQRRLLSPASDPERG